jgi:hypothetical protein
MRAELVGAHQCLEHVLIARRQRNAPPRNLRAPDQHAQNQRRQACRYNQRPRRGVGRKKLLALVEQLRKLVVVADR